MSDVDQQREQWETFATLLKAGCSIPYELRHIERQYWEGVHCMVGKVSGRGMGRGTPFGGPDEPKGRKPIPH